MLRLLEYYSGCLFLSSNRTAESIDAAIASRITVMLSYPPLDEDGRAKVWRNLIQLIPLQPEGDRGKLYKYRNDFSEEDYLTLAHGYLLNGRQIKNSIILARALARERGDPLSMLLLRRAVTAVAGESSVLDVKIVKKENKEEIPQPVIATEDEEKIVDTIEKESHILHFNLPGPVIATES